MNFNEYMIVTVVTAFKQLQIKAKKFWASTGFEPMAGGHKFESR